MRFLGLGACDVIIHGRGRARRAVMASTSRPDSNPGAGQPPRCCWHQGFHDIAGPALL
jgi:hypothetical protein